MNFNNFHNQNKRGAYKRGFTLIELLVTMGVFALVTGVVLANYGSYSSRSILDNLAYDIALSVRQAQLFGISVRSFDTGSGAVFPSYGINFRATDPSTFILFADHSPENDRYDLDESVEMFRLPRGTAITALCGYTTSTAQCTSLSALDITFQRPDPDATFIGTPDNPYAYVTVTVAGGAEISRTIVVWANGQIAIQ